MKYNKCSKCGYKHSVNEGSSVLCKNGNVHLYCAKCQKRTIFKNAKFI